MNPINARTKGKKRQPIQWTTEDAFDRFKNALDWARIFCPPNFTIIESEDVATGDNLTQEIDDSERIVAYATTTSRSEMYSSIMELEIIAVFLYCKV